MSNSQTVSVCLYCGECYCYVCSIAEDSIRYCSQLCEDKDKGEDK